MTDAVEACYELGNYSQIFLFISMGFIMLATLFLVVIMWRG